MTSGERGLVCRICRARVAVLPAPRCERCGHPRLRAVCAWCALLPPYVRAARSVAWMPDGVAGALVHRLKYDGWTALAELMGERMARVTFPRDVVEERSVLVPVPLAPVRERERGFNQSTLLATAVGRRWGIPVRAHLVRTRATTSQTRLTPGGRRNNVAGAFSVASPPAELVGRHVVVVDDVVTTAATLNACAAALHAGGARIISYVTFGRARAAGDAP
jgi:ComF family protein